VVTGASRGIGAVVAGALAEAGAAVVLAARTTAEIEARCEELRARGLRAHPATCDVTDPDAVARLAREALQRLGAVSILVNNAGIASSAPLAGLSLQEWDRLLAGNATSAFLCTRAFLPGMLAGGWGRIVNVASTAGLAGGRYIAGYSASKHALVGLTRSVALEVADSGVTVNAVCPGYVDTPMTERSVSRIMEKTGRSREEATRAMLAASGQRRLIRPGEVASSILHLCSEGAASINGQALVLGGGAA